MKPRIIFLAVLVFILTSLAGCDRRTITLVKDTVNVELGEQLVIGLNDLTDLNEKEMKKASIDISDVDTMTPGIYKAHVTYRKNQYPFTVIVEDTTAPVAEITDTFVIPAGEPLYAEKIINNILELTGKVHIEFKEFGSQEQEPSESVEQQFSQGNVAYNNAAVIYMDAGEYNNTLILSDDAGNKTDYNFHITVCTNPILSGVKDISIEEGKEINYLDGITAADCFGNDISEKIICDSSSVDTNQPGTYLIKYTIADNYGFSAESEANITVNEKPKSVTPENNTSQTIPGDGWVPYSTSSLKSLTNDIANGYVVYYNGQYWASPEYVNMLTNEVIVYENDISQN